MFKWLYNKLTNNYNKIPLFFVNFNLSKYQLNGAKNSCIVKIHPELKNDKYIVESLNNLIDYIRDNYNMDKLSK